MSDNNEKKPTTLTDDEMVTEAHVGRRSALGLIGAGVVGAARADETRPAAARAVARRERSMVFSLVERPVNRVLRRSGARRRASAPVRAG